jgi:hypothetical protein
MHGIAVTLTVAVVLAATPTRVAHLDPHLGDRARDYFLALERADYDTLWQLSSGRVRSDGGDQEEFAQNLRDRTPYDLHAELLAGWSDNDRGEVYLRLSIRWTRGSNVRVSDYVSTWVFENGDWVLDDLSLTNELEQAVKVLPAISAAPN